MTNHINASSQVPLLSSQLVVLMVVMLQVERVRRTNTRSRLVQEAAAILRAVLLSCSLQSSQTGTTSLAHVSHACLAQLLQKLLSVALPMRGSALYVVAIFILNSIICSYMLLPMLIVYNVHCVILLPSDAPSLGIPHNCCHHAAASWKASCIACSRHLHDACLIANS